MGGHPGHGPSLPVCLAHVGNDWAQSHSQTANIWLQSLQICTEIESGISSDATTELFVPHVRVKAFHYAMSHFVLRAHQVHIASNADIMCSHLRFVLQNFFTLSVMLGLVLGHCENLWFKITEGLQSFSSVAVHDLCFGFTLCGLQFRKTGPLQSANCRWCGLQFFPLWIILRILITLFS